jgi:hypothetical protein
MLQTFKVAGRPVKAQDVDTDATVVLTDTGIQTPPSPAPPTVTVEVENQGTEPHSFVIVKLNGSATFQDVDKYFDAYEGGPLATDAPGEVLSGVGDIPPGKSVYLSWTDLPPGRYAYASTSGDSEAPGGDDIAKGLYGEFEIQ